MTSLTHDNQPQFLSLPELASRVPSGVRLGIGGFHFSRLPIALIRTVVQPGGRALDFISWGGSRGLEMLLAAGAVLRTALCFNSLGFQTAAVHSGGDETYHWYYQRGRVTHEVVGAAQIDRFSNTNNIESALPAASSRTRSGLPPAINPETSRC